MKFRYLSLILLMALALTAIAPLMAQGATECEDGFRLFDHELLAEAVCVPENPQRVVALDPFAYELLILNGTPPVGAIGYLEAVYSGNFPYLAEAMADIESVGVPANVELILALNPDLIVGSFLDEEITVQLAAIAPTVSYATAGSGDWKRPMRMVGDLLGLTELVNDLFAQYDARLRDLHATVENPADIEVSIIRVQPDRLMLNLVNSFPAVIVTDAGFGRPASQAYSEEEAIAAYGGAVGAFISLEEIQLADGDYIFAWSNQGSADENAEADANWERVQASPLWNALTAAQDNTAYRVRGHWLGWGIFAAHGIIDDLFTYVAGVDPAEVSPNPFLAAQDDDSESTTQTFTDDDGRIVEIPVNPQRILFADIEHAAMVTSLGYVPYAMASTWEGSDFAAQLEYLGGNVGDLSSIIDIGSGQEPNLERILEIQPDLIIWWVGMPEIVAQLQLIAPTIAMNPRVNGPGGGSDGLGGPRYSKQRIYTSLVGLEDELDAQIAEYEALLAEVIERHGDSLANLEWNFMDTGDDFLPHMYSPAKFPQWAYVAVMNDLGLNPSAAMVEATRNFIGYEEDYGYAQVSLEVVADYAADLLFLGRYDDLPINEQLLILLNTTAPGQANQIYRVDSNVWTYHVVQAEISVLRQIDEILSSGVEDVGDFSD
jgi:iron complex transport system substrate-binding protein